MASSIQGEIRTVDDAVDILCVDASGHAVVHVSLYFNALKGDAVKSCSVAHVDSAADALTVDIDFHHCKENPFRQRLTCHPGTAPGAFACSDALSSDPSDPRAIETHEEVLTPLPEDKSKGAP